METELSLTMPFGPLLMMLVLYWSAVILYFRQRIRVEARDQVLRALDGATEVPVYVGVRLRLMPLVAALLLPFLLVLILFR